MGLEATTVDELNIIEPPHSPENDMVRDHCGLVALHNPNNTIQYLDLVPGLKNVNHRGQEGVGIAGAGADGLGQVFHGRDLVSDNEAEIAEILDEVSVAVGHCRYSTSGDLGMHQPFSSDKLILAHNGNITNPLSLLGEMVDSDQAILVSDTHCLFRALENRGDATFEERLQEILPKLEGAFSLTIADPETGALYLVRDPWGFRPLHYAQLKDGETTMATSEKYAFGDQVDSQEDIQSIDRGQCLKIDETGISEVPIEFPDVPEAQCIFEAIYIGHPISEIFGIDIMEYREACGAKLASTDIEKGFIPDLVIPIRDSGNPAGEEYGRKMIEHLIEEGELSPREIAMRASTEAVIRNRYASKRTFIAPEGREKKVDDKFAVVPSKVQGKKVVLVDDSLVRGTTMKRLAKRVRDAGAAEVHIRIASPPIRYGCYYGVDFTGKDAELIADGKTIQEVSDILGLDSLAYIPLEDSIRIAQELAGEDACFCDACFSGEYPVAVDEDLLMAKAPAC